MFRYNRAVGSYQLNPAICHKKAACIREADGIGPSEACCRRDEVSGYAVKALDGQRTVPDHTGARWMNLSREARRKRHKEKNARNGVFHIREDEPFNRQLRMTDTNGGRPDAYATR